MSSSQKSVRLENPYVPVAYNLSVSVDISTWCYATEETVRLQRCPAYPDGDTIQLHAAPSIEVVAITGAKLVQRDEAAHTLVLKLDAATLAAAEPTLQFSFKHGINKSLEGFYQVRATYEGKEHRMASTQFEPISARLFYICQDEPAQRADFTLTVTLPKSEEHYTVLSNGPLISKTVTDDSVVHAFQMVPKCPPYLTACIVGELEHISTEVNGIPIRMFTTLGKIGRAQFALDTTAFALNYFEKFFQCKYPLPKLDVVAIPDYPLGGMENWGCITCTESILVEPARTSVDMKSRVSNLVCHEVAHNWFGNLVAINWWEGLWLKEGFASWCGYYATNAMAPQWKALDSASLGVAGALADDMYEHSHPVEVPIRDPAAITEIFDSISYNKGMGLVFMLQAFLGEKWGPSVAHYINKYQYKDTKTVQLWEALEEASQVPITEALNSFTSQMGYPMVHVARKDDNTIVVAQEACRFVTATQKSEQTWCVPLVVEGLDPASGRVASMLRESRGVEVALPAGVAGSAFVNANPSRTGFYRCHYDDPTFDAWVAHYGKLGAPDRRALFSDTLAAVNMGYDDIPRLAKIATAVAQSEKDIFVLREYMSTMSALLAAFDDAALASGLREEFFGFLIPTAESLLATAPADDAAAMQRNFFIESAIATLMKREPAPPASQPVLQWAVKEAESFFAGGAFNMGTLNYSLAVWVILGDAAARPERHAQLFAKLKESDGNDEVCRALLFAMSNNPSTEFAIDVMKKCMLNEGVRSQYGPSIFYGLSVNPVFKGADLWNVFKDNFEGIDRQWGRGQFQIQGIVIHVTRTLSGAEMADEFEAFFKEHPAPSARLVIGRAAESIRLRAWLNNKWKSSLARMFGRH